ncbi:glycosyl-transferase for dystroglycan-domain-containing protein [Umbelopsis sp. AD052]|nr:glycosyl-transferase for dystroglycan-domain-containing protein [Umbelopsis sp. AD052]
MVNHVYTRLRSRIRRRWRAWSRQKPASFTTYIAVAVLILFLWSMLHGRSKQVHEPRLISLHDQPNYTPPTHQSCQVKICNPSGVCSMWGPGSYDWKQLADHSVYRDVASVDVEFGCEAVLRVEQTENVESITVGNERLTCSDDMIGLDTKCRNVIEITIESNLYIAGTQVRDHLNRPATKDTELVVTWEVVQHSDQNLNDITLVSQFSVNRLEIFERVLDAWSGPISISIYLTHPSDIETFINYFTDEQKRNMYARCTITIVKPNYSTDLHLRYPINHLRNLAIVASTTDYLYVIDADFVPGRNLYQHSRSKLVPYLNKSKLVAMVVPCLAVTETSLDYLRVETASDIRSLFRQNKAFITDPRAGHGPTHTRQLGLSHALKPGNYYEVCYESQWEPYYIVHKSAPLYDARFRNQGGDKQSHALMLNALGYRFLVANNVFMVHTDHSAMVWPGGGLAKAQREERQWTYFDGFMREMEQLFGRNVRWPRGCSAKAVGWQDQRRDVLGMAAGSAM